MTHCKSFDLMMKEHVMKGLLLTGMCLSILAVVSVTGCTKRPATLGQDFGLAYTMAKAAQTLNLSSDIIVSTYFINLASDLVVQYMTGSTYSNLYSRLVVQSLGSSTLL